MYRFTFGLLVLFALFSLIVAIPKPEPDSNKIDELEKRTGTGSFTGRAIEYSPSAVGISACGRNNTDDDIVVGIPGMFFDFAKRCGTIITIQAVDSNDNPKSDPVNATIVDQCDYCSNSVFELSPALWKQIGGVHSNFPPPIDISFNFSWSG